VELRHLRYFVAVAEMENVSRAALKLHVSQPALSRQIRDLEDEIGFCLLQRTAKSVRLTNAGRKFLDDARALLQKRGRSRHESARGCKRRAYRAPRRLLTDTNAEILRKSHGHFSERCQTSTSDCTIGA